MMTGHPEMERAEAAMTELRGVSAELTAFGESEWLADLALWRMGFQPIVAARRSRRFYVSTQGRSRARFDGLEASE
jgi:hypothetical protein